MTRNQRRQERKATDQLVFCQLDGDDGGAVLNISEGGLCFETFAPVRQEGLVHFWFSLDLKKRIEAMGKVVWLDSTRRLGGLSFIGLSHHARERIRAWLSERSLMPERRAPWRRVSSMPKLQQEPAAAAVTAQEAPGNGSSKPDRGAGSWRRFTSGPGLQDQQATSSAPVWEAPVNVSGEADIAKGPKNRKWPLVLVEAASDVKQMESEEIGSVGPATPEFFNESMLVPVERYRSATRKHFIQGVLVGIVISSAVAIPAFKFSKGGNQSSVHEASAQVAAAQPDAEGVTAAGSTAEGARSSFIPASTATSQRAKASGPSGYAAGNPFDSGQRSYRQQSQRSSTAGQATQSTVQASFEESRRSRKTSASPEQLWSSVQAGSSKAAVALAELYIRGDGVPVNCDQARVLLLVASEKNNKEAIKRLQDLDKTGCPTVPH